MVEPFSVDESWLDVTASRRLFGTGSEIADTIRNRVKNELGLTLSAGVSYNKIFAKMGSDYKKPDATTVISRENYKELLWPMDIDQLFFVGRATADKLRTVKYRCISFFFYRIILGPVRIKEIDSFRHNRRPVINRRRPKARPS